MGKYNIGDRFLTKSGTAEILSKKENGKYRVEFSNSLMIPTYTDISLDSAVKKGLLTPVNVTK